MVVTWGVANAVFVLKLKLVKMKRETCYCKTGVLDGTFSENLLNSRLIGSVLV